MQNRWRSRVLWVSIASLIGLFLKTYYKVDMDEFDKVVNMTLSVFLALGIINNPEKNDSL